MLSKEQLEMKIRQIANSDEILERLDRLEEYLSTITQSVAADIEVEPASIGTETVAMSDINGFTDQMRDKIIREDQVKQINASSDSMMKLIYARENYWRSQTKLNAENDTPLSAEELEQINSFWAPYKFAYKNNPETQRIYSRISGKFDPSYISWEFQYNALKPFWETLYFRRITFKNLIVLLFPYVPMPKTYVMYGWGQYLDGQTNVISKFESMS